MPDLQALAGRIVFWLQRLRFIWLNLLFAAYLVFLQPGVLQRMASHRPGVSPDWLMGGLLLAVQAAEVAGLLLKRPVSAFYARNDPDTSAGRGWRANSKIVLVIFTPILHLCAAAFLSLVALDLLGMGYAGEGKTNFGWLSLLVFFIVLIKEAFMVVLILALGSGGSLPRARPARPVQFYERLESFLQTPWIDRVTLKDALKDLLGDLLLLVFAALTYTAGWEFITAGSGVRNFMDYVGVSLLFLVIYAATRAVYLVQELSIRNSRAARVFSWASFLAVWLAALWALS